MVGGDDEYIVFAQLHFDGLEAGIDQPQRPGIAAHVVAVAEEHVRFDEVDEHQPLLRVADQPREQVEPLGIAARMEAARNAPLAEDIADLAHADDGDICGGQSIEQRLPGRFEGIVLPVFRAPEMAAFVVEKRTGDDPAHGALARHDGARRLADLVQLRQRQDGGVGGDLHHGILRCI